MVKFERSKSTEHKFENTFGRSKRVSRRLYHFAFSFFFFYGFYACCPLQSTLNMYNFGWSATTDKFHLASNNSHETKPVPCPAPCLLPFIFPPLVVGSSAPVRYTCDTYYDTHYTLLFFSFPSFHSYNFHSPSGRLI